MEPITKDARERAGNSLYPGLTDWIGVGSMGRYYLTRGDAPPISAGA